jgi:CubicO group peptidase (beta-lactamase class C family)
MIALRALAVAAMCLLSAGHVAAQASDTQVPSRVDEIFKRWTSSSPGCAVGADVKGVPVVRRAYGLADLEHDAANRADTIFESGSVAKQFTAMAVLLLAKDGKLSLDDAVRKHVPELPESAAAVTVRQMLQHTGGLRDWGYLVAISGWPRGSRVHTHEHVLDVLSRQRALNFAPGTDWSYSNSGYNLAAILVSRLSGMSFAEFTKARIFDPLGMTDSSWRDDWTRVVKRRAVAYGERRGAFVTNMPFENVHGNGGMLTTVGDLLKWNANFETFVVGDATLLAEMQKPAVFTDGRAHEYAYGLYVDTYRGVREVDHSGGTAGYVAHLIRYPDRRVSVAVLCNVNTASATSYAKAVAALFLGDLKEPAPPAATHTLTAEEGAALAGLYRAPLPIGVIRVEAGQDGLSIRGIGRLIPQSATRFVTADRRTLAFDGRGGLRGVDEFGTVTELQRVEPAAPTPEALEELTGRYVSDEAETTLDVAIDSGRLVIRRRPGLVTPLTPVYADAFTGGTLGWVVFRRDRSGRVEALSLGQERVWDLRFSRVTDTTTR